jgi:hypothetical protein
VPETEPVRISQLSDEPTVNMHACCMAVDRGIPPPTVTEARSLPEISVCTPSFSTATVADAPYDDVNITWRIANPSELPRPRRARMSPLMSDRDAPVSE